MLKTLLEPIGRRFRAGSAQNRRTAFDPIYYLRRYPDLAHLPSADAAIQHYLHHGKPEGRFPNALLEEEDQYRQYLVKSSHFDLAAYKALNPDLESAFSEDKDYILHFIRHGRREGRRAVFEVVEEAERPLWLVRFSVSQFSAWVSDWMEAPTDAGDAIREFQARGIERLAPVRFDHVFDPVFYRSYYGDPEALGDVELYRSWLSHGLPQGRAPSESRLLLPYIGEAAFPECFDWQAYASAHSLKARLIRTTALVHLFENETDWNSAKYYMRRSKEELQLVLAIIHFRLRQGRAKEADSILRAWDTQRNDWPPAMWLARGDAHAAIGQTIASSDAYEQAIEHGEKSLRAVIGAARAHLSLQAFERALNLLRSQRSRWLQKADFERLIDDLIERIFGQASAEAHAALAAISEHDPDQVKIARINQNMERALDLIVRAISELEVAPARLEARVDGHIAILGNEDLRQCKHYRIEQKQEQLEAAGFEVRRRPTHEANVFLEDLLGAQVAIFYRLPATPPVIRAILTARRMGIPTYYDIDDLIFSCKDYPPPYETYQSSIALNEYRGLQFGVPLFRFAMSLCDRAIASTPILLEYMLPIVRDGKGFVLRNGLDSRNEPIIALGSRPSIIEGDRIRIFYGSGTLAHNADFTEIVSPALAQVMDIDQKVDLVLIGHVPYDLHLRRHSARIMRYPFISNVGDYWSVLSSCDINIAPLLPEPTTDCKSEIKWLEAAVLRIPTVVSGTATYRDVVSPNVDGFIADTTEQWFDIIFRLCAEPELRHRIGTAARKKALLDYSLDQGAAVLRSELSVATAKQTNRTRVLVCNVFFSPQSIGGATRVVESNVSDIARHEEDIELAVFCTDEGIGTSGRMRTSQFGDVPVFRVGIQPAVGMDQVAFNDECLDAFRTALDLFDPHIVHFHCIQRLTASVARECLSRKIPYVITVHDAWWISPYQFLVDDFGLLRLPSSDPLSGFTDDPDRTANLLQRRRALDAMLYGAERVVAVSESFAEVYRSAGVVTVSAIPNGVSNLPAAPLPDGYKGKLRLALIGGRSSHKGSDLVEAALRLGYYPNLHLLLIDGWLAPGEHVETLWGATTVTISAPVAQGDIATLYGSIDVLLAPSRWPESFGLVTREAAHFGLWVVASSLGGMGEDIVEGNNGYRIDTKDRRDLDRILTLLNENPDGHRQGTALRVEGQRTAHQQAKELADLYRSIAPISSGTGSTKKKRLGQRLVCSS